MIHYLIFTLYRLVVNTDIHTNTNINPRGTRGINPQSCTDTTLPDHYTPGVDPDLYTNTNINPRGTLIHSLAQTLHYLTTTDQEQIQLFEDAQRPIKWYWGLIQVINWIFFPNFYILQ